MGKIHAADAGRSIRLLKVLAALDEAGTKGLTTRELIEWTGCCAVNSIAAELRAAGHNVTCGYERTTDNGQRVYRYRLVQSGQLEMFPATPQR